MDSSVQRLAHASQVLFRQTVALLACCIFDVNSSERAQRGICDHGLLVCYYFAFRVIQTESHSLIFSVHQPSCPLETSVVRYPRYLDTYRRYLRDDTSIANVTIYRGIS